MAIDTILVNKKKYSHCQNRSKTVLLNRRKTERERNKTKTKKNFLPFKFRTFPLRISFNSM